MDLACNSCVLAILVILGYLGGTPDLTPFGSILDTSVVSVDLSPTPDSLLWG